MLTLSDFCFFKDKRELWSVGCGSAGCVASKWCSFIGTVKKCSVKVPVG